MNQGIRVQGLRESSATVLVERLCYYTELGFRVELWKAKAHENSNTELNCKTYGPTLTRRTTVNAESLDKTLPNPIGK